MECIHKHTARWKHERQHRLVIKPVCSLRLHTFLSVVSLYSKLKIKQENKHRQHNNLQSALNFLCVSDIDFILCIGYFFYPYPHRCTSVNILVSAQSAFNMGTDILVTCISRYGVAPTFYCGFIESQPIFLA